MKIEDFGGAYYIKTAEELQGALKRRFGNDANELWLSSNEAKFPALAIMVRGNLCCLHYFPQDGHPGFISQGTELDGEGATIFYSGNPNVEQEMPNENVVPFENALNAATEFLVSAGLPRAIDWLEL